MAHITFDEVRGQAGQRSAGGALLPGFFQRAFQNLSAARALQAESRLAAFAAAHAPADLRGLGADPTAIKAPRPGSYPL